jgi:hypothetical protein
MMDGCASNEFPMLSFLVFLLFWQDELFQPSSTLMAPSVTQQTFLAFLFAPINVNPLHTGLTLDAI